MITHKLNKLIKSLFYYFNINISATTEKHKLLTFLSSVRPVTTEYELIRIGGDADGGYLIPNDIEHIESCFSPGVNNIADFEDALTKRGIKCYLADYSVVGPPFKNRLFDFEAKYIGSKNDDIFITLEDWINRKKNNVVGIRFYKWTLRVMSSL